MEVSKETEQYIGGLVSRARAAMDQIQNLTQEDVRRISKAIGWLAINRAEEWADFNYNETKMGRIPSKIDRTRPVREGLHGTICLQKQWESWKWMRQSSW
ncbi:hypothetical protein [Clostridium sp. AM58-1XD]|uniref:hypothetical protein n=1 Tax=Clostridium sp. AM58-1XD TaxID=2292307 RepID=UPI000E50D78F|nr:hypothetical protein [Clostridium sp. AM58-1XD]RGY98274.1 hypothetical protein DXA13_12090 [Clostridium sp. AM58-1XD]